MTQKTKLTDGERKQRRDANREKFVKLINSKPDHIVKRIAVAYRRSYDRVSVGFSEINAIKLELRDQFLEGYTINGRPMTYRQAGVFYEVARKKFNGNVNIGFYGKELDPEDSEIVKQSVEDCLIEQDLAMRN